MRSAIFVLAVVLATGAALSLPYLPLFPLDQIPIVGQLYTILAGGVLVTMPVNGGTAIHVGLVAVPLEFMCTNAAIKHDTCRLCYIDCQVAHNASYGYGCGGNQPANAPGDKCYCEYDTTKAVPSIDTLCGDYEANTLHNPAVNTAIDQVLVTFLRARYQTVLCNPLVAQNSSCMVECPDNHWSQSGYCAGYDANDNTLTSGYCICDY